jgi:hypothetical protein
MNKPLCRIVISAAELFFAGGTITGAEPSVVHERTDYNKTKTGGQS